MSTHDNCRKLIDEALDNIKRALRRVGNIQSKKVTKGNDLVYFKSLAYSWSETIKPTLVQLSDKIDFSEIDTDFACILDATTRQSVPNTYKKALKSASKKLAQKRSEMYIAFSSDMDTLGGQQPDFSLMVHDSVMLNILHDRWLECQKCLNAGAYLAATVMMGGLLEAVLVARVNFLDNKSILFECKTIPTDRTTGKPLPLKKWKLGAYIDISHEMGWITQSAKGVASVLRNYRNYVHPVKQRSENVTVGAEDAEMFWSVTKHLINQILESSKQINPGD